MRRQKTTPKPSRLDRLPEEDLIRVLETALLRSSELFRGLSHREIDKAWILSEMHLQVTSAEQAIQALQRRIDV